MSKEVRELRAAIAALPSHHRRFAPELRTSLRAYVKREVAAGATRSAVARALGVSQPTVARLLAERTSQALVPIVVVNREPEAGRLTIRGPHGLVVENLDVESVAALIRALS